MRRLASASTVALIVTALATAVAIAVVDVRPTATAPMLRLVRVDSTEGITAMASRPGTHTLYLAQQDGVVRALRTGGRSSTRLLDLTDRVSQDGGERGLLGIAFSPDGKQLYLDYTDRAGNTQVDELTMRGDRVDARSRRNVLEVDQPQPNHNGGQLAFGPDGYLYVALGDGGAAGDRGPGHAPGGNGQSLDTLLGKILRIDPQPSAGAPYTVPPDNPFVATPGARPEIWAFGLRNPWRFSFDRETGDLWIGDVGQNRYEEIDHVPATEGRDAGKGDNFGWNRLEGNHPYQGAAPSDAVPPVYEISHDTGACAVVGGYVARSPELRAISGNYLFSDNCDGAIRLLVPDSSGFTMRESGLVTEAVSSFGQANDGTLYVVSMTDGVYRVAKS